jgi:hypothetical protein
MDFADSFPLSGSRRVARNATETNHLLKEALMPRQRYEIESLGPVIVEIERREKSLRAIRPSIAKADRKDLDLRLQALEESRQILSSACKTAPKMNAFFDGDIEE